MISLQKRQNDIVVLRVMSMLMIVLCHIIQYYSFLPGAQMLGNVFDVGVVVFFLVSGYLYGQKERSPFAQFMCNRLKRIYVPVILLLIVDIAIMYFVFSEPYSIATIISYFMNLQGLLFIYWDLFVRFFEQIPNLGPLWFTTVIMICYCMVPMLHFLRKKLGKTMRWSICITAFCACAALRYAFEIDLFYFAIFYLGFLWADCAEKEQKMKNGTLLLFSVILLAVQFLRLYFQKTVDGTDFYFAFAGISHAALGLLIFALAIELKKRFPKTFDKFAANVAVKAMDKTSFHVYLVHGVFCMGATNIYKLVPNLWLATALFFAATVASTILLYNAERLTLKILRAY